MAKTYCCSVSINSNPICWLQISAAARGAFPASCIFKVGGFRTLVNVPHLSVCLLHVTLLQNSANMPEVRELSEALSEMSMDPITGVGVVASRNRAPTGYDVVRSK